jgi:hypothetical protein
MLTTEDIKKFLLIESSQIPLKEVRFEDVQKTIIDPTTGKPYKGIILEGCFADLSATGPNNNNRFYDIPTYLELIKILKKQIFSAKGLYGELEHPKGYAVDTKNASHRIIDIWWDENLKQVWGRVLLLDTPNGLTAQQIIKSGGQLGISARAAGEELKQSDGTFKCKVKLMTTFDLVYHPGFTASVLSFKVLNESQQFMQNLSENKSGFSLMIYDEDIMSLETKFVKYLQLNESAAKQGQLQYCFFEWLNLNESEKKSEQDKQDEDTIEKNEPSDQKEIENRLSSSVDSDLKEQEKQKFFECMDQAVKNKGAGAYYQGAAGFVETGI